MPNNFEKNLKDNDNVKVTHDIVRRVVAAKTDMLEADKIIGDYIPFIRAEASKATARIINESDDEMSIAMIAFHDAIRSYSKIRGAFLSYASIVIKRRLIDYFRKESRHYNQLSLDEAHDNDDNKELGLIDRLVEDNDAYSEIVEVDAAKQEIVELSAQICEFNLSLTDISENAPKQDRTLAQCQIVIEYAKKNPEIVEELLQSKKLPMTKIVAGTGVSKKTIERHRKYIVVLLLIYSNGYEIIRGHLKQVYSSELSKKGKGELL